eukprot:3003579-Lingulodinium_polyedra.AAC.1
MCASRNARYRLSTFCAPPRRSHNWTTFAWYARSGAKTRNCRSSKIAACATPSGMVPAPANG